MKKSENYLFISDLQIPFEHSKALQFCKHLQKYFNIPQTNVFCVGDELDLLFGSLYKKNPNWKLSPVEEIEITIQRLKAWYDAFPILKLAVSNHGIRWRKKALEAEIPEILMRRYSEVIEAPKTWEWKEEFIIRTLKQPIRMIHGMGYSGSEGHRKAALDGGINTVIGHLHAFAGISHINTGAQKIWGMNTGCLINPDAIAFEYGKYNRFKPVLGAGVVINSDTPLWLPLE